MSDLRWVKFRECYTTQEHLMDLHDDLVSLGRPGTAAFEGLREGFDQLNRSQQEVARVTAEGFESLAQEFHWGLASIAHEMELSREIYREIRNGILYPAATAGQEFRQRAETALENGWWEEAVTNLERALAENSLDFLAHFHLGQVLWFHLSQWEQSLKQFELAARYSDTKRSTTNQNYYATLAYIHISLLWRMHSAAFPEDSAEAIRKAYNATQRAFELNPGFLVTRVEHSVNCAHSNALSQIKPLILEDARTDKARLVAYRVNPDLRLIPEIQQWVEEAGRTIESIPEEQKRLNLERESEVQEAARQAAHQAELMKKAAAKAAATDRWWASVAILVPIVLMWLGLAAFLFF